MKSLYALLLLVLIHGYPSCSMAQDKPVYRIGVAMASTTITTAAYVQLDAALDASCSALDVFNSGANPIYLALGAASSEINIPYLIPIAMTAPVRVHIPLPIGKRLSARSLSADVTAGFLIINCLQ